MPTVFIDANIPIYTVGYSHRLKDPCIRVLQLVADRPQSFVTSAEVLQVTLHLSLRILRDSRGFREFADLMRGRIEPVYARDVERARSLAEQYTAIEARDCVHAAVMQRIGLRQIISSDRRLSRARCEWCVGNGE